MPPPLVVLPSHGWHFMLRRFHAFNTPEEDAEIAAICETLKRTVLDAGGEIYGDYPSKICHGFQYELPDGVENPISTKDEVFRGLDVWLRYYPKGFEKAARAYAYSAHTCSASTSGFE